MADTEGRKDDPLVGFQFRLDLGGRVVGYFTSVNGLGSEHDVAEHKVTDAGGHAVIFKVPGRIKWDDLTLSLGVTNSLDIWKWRKDVEDGDMKKARQNCSVTMMDRNFVDAAKWDFLNAWPKKVSGPQPKADSNDFSIEEMIITHEGLVRNTA